MAKAGRSGVLVGTCRAAFSAARSDSRLPRLLEEGSEEVGWLVGREWSFCVAASVKFYHSIGSRVNSGLTPWALTAGLSVSHVVG